MLVPLSTACLGLEREAFDVAVRCETSTSGRLYVSCLGSPGVQKTESKAVRSEEANVTAQAVQPHVAPELLPELPVHSAAAAPQTWGI